MVELNSIVGEYALHNSRIAIKGKVRAVLLKSILKNGGIKI